MFKKLILKKLKKKNITVYFIIVAIYVKMFEKGKIVLVFNVEIFLQIIISRKIKVCCS